MNEGSTQMDEILTWCIQVIEKDGWTVEDCLAHHASIQQELDPMLRAAMALRRASDLVPAVTFQRVAKSRLQLRLQASNRPPEPQTVTFSKSPRSIGHIWNLLRQRRFEMATIIAVIALVVSSIFGGVIYAADASGPGDALYGVDLAVEDLRMQFAANDESLTKLKLKLASERLEEAEIKLEEGASSEDITLALAAFDKILAELEDLLENGSLTPEQQVEIETAIAALHAAEQATGLDVALEVELEDGELEVEIGADNDNGDVNDNGSEDADADNDNGDVDDSAVNDNSADNGDDDDDGENDNGSEDADADNDNGDDDDDGENDNGSEDADADNDNGDDDDDGENDNGSEDADADNENGDDDDSKNDNGSENADANNENGDDDDDRDNDNGSEDADNDNTGDDDSEDDSENDNGSEDADADNDNGDDESEENDNDADDDD